MKILDDGHKYELGEEPFSNFVDNAPRLTQTISFIKRGGEPR